MGIPCSAPTALRTLSSCGTGVVRIANDDHVTQRLSEAGKPETFDFLGFTHFCRRSRKWGSFVIARKTIKKRIRARLLAIKIELRRTMHDPVAKTGAWMKRMLQGHLNYSAVSGNHPSPWWFFNKVRRLWLMSSVGSENVCYRELITRLRTCAGCRQLGLRQKSIAPTKQRRHAASTAPPPRQCLQDAPGQAAPARRVGGREGRRV
jgi:hypothetical protein